MSRLPEDPNYGWWLFGVLLALVAGYVLVSFVGVVVFGLFIYYSTRPVYRIVNARLGRPRVSAAVSLFALALPALLVVGYAVAIGIRELQTLGTVPGVDLVVSPEIAALIEGLQDPAGLVREAEQLLSSDFLTSVLNSLSSAADTALLLAVGLVQLFVMIVLAFYLLREDRRLAAWVVETFDDREGTLSAFLLAIDYDLRSIFFGNILNAFVTGAIGVFVFSALNVIAPPGVGIPAAALLGLIAGVASLVPVVGMKLVYVPVALYLTGRAVLIAGSETLWFVALFVALSFVVVDTIPDLILRPYVSGRSLHVGAVMLAYTLGPLLFGWYGLFLMPVLLVIVVQFSRIVLPQLLGEEPVSAPPVDPYLLEFADPDAIGKAVDGDLSASPPLDGPRSIAPATTAVVGPDGEPPTPDGSGTAPEGDDGPANPDEEDAAGTNDGATGRNERGARSSERDGETDGG